MRIGLDIGSTTIKAAVLDDNDNLIYKRYERHYSQVAVKALEVLTDIQKAYPRLKNVKFAISGSAGMGVAESCDLNFVQEVYATGVSAEHLIPEADVIIELGGEDAKILFLQGSVDARMNGSCAGGTGAFIDQMSTLLHVTPEELNELAKKHEKIYTVASRCGVFAKSDIQPLLNQGAREADIAASIFYAVVNQTIGGLAQGKPIIGNIIYLGGPLSFLSELRESFDNALNTKGICPENSLYYVAMGAAFCASDRIDISDIISKLKQADSSNDFVHIDPLFATESDYLEFKKRHQRSNTPRRDMIDSERVFIGIDAGSTTIKFAVISESGELLDSKYQSNSGNPTPLVREYLMELYNKYPGLNICASAVTGYGEDLIKNAFGVDYGLVETVAHFKAAKHIEPEVDFILDIGGQDIKCMKIHNDVIDNIYLNEACSSGCGSFLQTFANALDYEIHDFAEMGLRARKPVDLGSRCTVFMNSSVKQAQKDGASTQDISAGLSISVVKNALYKVIRMGSADELGDHIVVQGGSFYNDAVLRAFEMELGKNVIRPDISGLMGAFGAALYALEMSDENADSSILSFEELKAFTHEVKTTRCGLCANNCSLTINKFENGSKYISGNRCERPVTKKSKISELNMYHQKRKLLKQYRATGDRKKIGIPMGLNMYELIPFWRAFFDVLGFDIITSPDSDHALYLKGQHTIPSDTVCYPAKLMHGHIQYLLDNGVETIFYPCMSYNLDEGVSDNCFNCPIVAYYPEVLNANIDELKNVNFIYCYLGLHRKKDVPSKLYANLKNYFPEISLKLVDQGVKAGYKAYEEYMIKVKEIGEEIISKSREAGIPIVALVGRPYHIDPEINHGIDKLIVSLGASVISEDAISDQIKEKMDLNILNQWTYHNRMYSSAKVVTEETDMQFVQLVSFGCGCDAITTDECRSILENEGKIYTQIKIDEINNLGAAKIRLRSLFAAAGMKESKVRL